MVSPSAGHGSLIGAMLGEYKVEALIGRGAMGTVYLARDTKLNRLVALKVLLGSLARTPSLVKQFHNEAQAAAPLHHPGIVRIYSAGIEDGTPYIAMEFVDGEPLDRFLLRKGKLSWDVALMIGGSIADALDTAHRSGIVHRDIKPSNIMLDRKGGVRLTDFGIASIQSGAKGAAANAGVIGTPQYMSPEQVTGKDVGPSSDLFALGVTLYQMIAGEMPFRGESSMALIKSICEDDPPRLNKLNASIPDDVARLVAYMIEKEPVARPANAKVVYSLINRLQKHRGGVSALSESLSSFIAEQTEARPFSGLETSRSPSTGKDSRIKIRSSGRLALVRWRRVAQIAAITLLALGALAVGPTLSSFARENRAGRAPTMDLASFQRLNSGAMHLYVLADGYELGRVSWVGKKPVALIEARGLPGSLTQGLTGLLAVDPVAEEVLSLHAPSGPGDMAATGTQNIGASFALAVPPMPGDSILADSFLLHARARGARPFITLAQRWDSAAPERNVLFRATEKQWLGGVDPQWESERGARVIMSPDGHTLCILLYDEETGGGYLVERDVTSQPLYRTGERRTTVGADILPESIQYSPDGSKIAYLRVRDDDTFELWLLSSHGVERNGHRLVGGITSPIFSFSPDGRLVAVVMREEDSSQSQVTLVDARLGEVQASFGAGILSREAWRADGRHLLFVAADETASPNSDTRGRKRQLYAVLIESPYTKTQLTYASDGLTGEYAVSRDSAWVAAVLVNRKVPTLFLQEWARADSREDA